MPGSANSTTKMNTNLKRIFSFDVWSSAALSSPTLFETLALGSILIFSLLLLLWPIDRLLVSHYPIDIGEFMLVVKNVLAGQQLNIDILTPIGPYFFYPMVWGYQLFGQMAEAINFAAFFHASVVMILIAAISHRHLSRLSTILLLLVGVVVCIQPSNLGEMSFSPAMEYNKYCYSILMIFFLELFYPHGKSWLDASILAICIYIMFMTKMSYVVVAFVAMALSFVLRQTEGRASIIWSCIIFAILFFVTPNHEAYIKDFIFSGFESGKTRVSIYNFVHPFLNNLYLFLFACIPLFCGLWLGHQKTRNYLIAFVTILGGSYAIITQNAQGVLLPSACSLFILFFEWEKEQWIKKGRQNNNFTTKDLRFLKAISLFLAMCYPVIILSNGLYVCIKYAYYIKTNGSGFQHVDVNEFTKGVFFRDGQGEQDISDELSNLKRMSITKENIDAYISTPALWFATLKDASELIQKNGISSGTIFTLDAINGPALLSSLSLTPQWHLWAQPGFKPLHAGKLFAPVNYVFVPLHPSHPAVYNGIVQNYAAYIKDHYQVKAKSDFWVICEKRNYSQNNKFSSDTCIPSAD